MPIIQERKNQYFITLPKEIVLKKKWRKGTRLIASFDQDGNVVFEELKEQN